MGWFFGCFGGSKKDRKHPNNSSPLPKQQVNKQIPVFTRDLSPPSTLPQSQKASLPLPIRVPPAASSSNSIKALNVQDEPSQLDLFTVRQISNSAPPRQARGILLQDGPSNQAPQKQQKLGVLHPPFQLDDLEKELQDLRKQIERESQDAKKSRDEVNFLKSGGTIATPPSELKKARRLEPPQNSVPEAGWHSWLASMPPISKTSTEKPIRNEGLRAALCEPTRTKESHGFSHAIRTPASCTGVAQSVLHHSPQVGWSKPYANEEHFDHLNKGTESDVSLQDGNKYINLKSPKMMIVQSKLARGLNNTASFGTQDPVDSMSDLLKKPGHSKQECKSVLIMEGASFNDASELDSNLTKKRRTSVQSPHTLKDFVDINVSGAEDRVLFQKRLKVISSGDQAKGEMKDPLLHADPVSMHFFRCDSLSPIVEVGASNEKPTSCDSKHISQETPTLNQLERSYNSNDSASQSRSQSPSLRQSPASQTRSVSCTSINDGKYTTDEPSFSHNAMEKCSGESYTESTCISDTNEDELATASYSPSIDSEETISDLSPEHCFSPPISPNHGNIDALHRYQDSSTSTFEEEQGKKHGMVSTQHSAAYDGGKKQYASRYYNEEDDKTDDDYDLYTDAVSHVSTECSEREHKNWHLHKDSMDSVSAQFAQMNQIIDPDSIATPPKLAQWIATPSVNIQGKHSSRLRSKPTSSVLTPVENTSQWKQLKEKDHKVDAITKMGNDVVSKSNPSGHMFGYQAVAANKKSWDENRHDTRISPKTDEGKKVASQEVPISVNASFSQWARTSEAEAILVNTSLSHWGSAPKSESIRTDASLSHWGIYTNEAEPVRVDASLSHWLHSSKQTEAHKSSGTSSSSSSVVGGGGLISPTSQPKQFMMPSLVQGPIRSSSHIVSERPILGAMSRDHLSANAKQRSPRDGNGTLNSTAKYKEDQRVKWHATPFEQRLEKALDKQGISLQKKLYAATPPSAF